MNYDNGQIRGHCVPRMPNEYPGPSGGRPPVPSGYPSHSLPGNVRYGYPQMQPQQGYMPRGYYPQQQQQQRYYPGDNNFANSQQFYQQPQPQPQQQQMYYQQESGYQYNPSQARLDSHQGFQQQGAMMQENSQYYQQPQEQFAYQQRFQYQPQQYQQMHSNLNQRPPFVRAPVRTGFRNPNPAYFPRPPPQPQQQNVVQQQMRPQMMPTQQPQFAYQQDSNWQQQPQSESQSMEVSSTSPTTVSQVPVVVASSANLASVETTTVVSSVTQPQPQLEKNLVEAEEVVKVLVPWGWARTILSEQVIYKSPSGIELKNKDDVKEYLLKEGTCKCGLECPLELDIVFDFDSLKQGEIAPIPESPPNPAKYCSHKSAIANMAKIISSPGYSHQFKHFHSPLTGKKGTKKRTRKKRPYSGVLTPEMIEAREAEKRRINEIITQQKREYEAQLSLSIGSKKSASIVMKPAPKEAVETPQQEIEEESQDKPEVNAKNIEIRRISATEEGDKVLEDAWSPEKEKAQTGKTPLQMVQSIVSKIEESKPTPTAPAWTQGGQHRPLLHSQKQVANDTPPSNRPLVLPQKATPISQNVTVMTTPQFVPVSANTAGAQFVPVSTHTAGVMQLVNTLNGPMLMQMPAAPPQIQIQDPSKNGAKPKVPILVSPQPSPSSAQHVLIQNPPQFVLNQPMLAPANQVFLSTANGTLVAMPTAPAVQGVVYNQLPDGTLVQVQSPVMAPAQGPSFVLNPAGQQMSPTSYFMTPAGLVQTVATTQPNTEPQPGPSAISVRKESTEESEAESEQQVKFVQTDEDEEESSDEEMPLAKRKISPKSLPGTSSGLKASIQSNKVDSSGLQATPPHHTNEESEINKLSSPELTRYDELDTSGSTDGGPSSSTKSPSKRKRKRNADELIQDVIMPNLDSDEESEKEEKVKSKPPKQFNVGELVWGPHGTFPSWPGKLVRFERDGSKVLVCWFGNRDTSQVNPHYLKSLSDGLEAHHRERKKLRKGRKMNASLEKAIQEAMMELDRMTGDD